ncbi:hypothetical protein DPEC_G00095700 [Dallia pectoralis]|uniref:Uncharacterized protein n=1 Tax=Dallia pectoralis TaxID=75939 RepID=A0ACC2GV97_DALPE|nr:hypothetical protein DPEC_G00095700 [Dallia pectoralis]
MKCAFKVKLPQQDEHSNDSEDFEDMNLDNEDLWEDVSWDDEENTYFLKSRQRLSCFAHSLQLVIHDGMKEVKAISLTIAKTSRFTRLLHSSTPFKEKFEAVFEGEKSVTISMVVPTVLDLNTHLIDMEESRAMLDPQFGLSWVDLDVSNSNIDNATLQNQFREDLKRTLRDTLLAEVETMVDAETLQNLAAGTAGTDSPKDSPPSKCPRIFARYQAHRNHHQSALNASISMNLALNGVAAQSSQFGIYKASVAIDGDRTSDFPTGSCSHTEEETNPWWRVVLSTVYRVSTVSLTNRKDCCSERLDGAEIRIGNSLENNGLNNPRCAFISRIPAGETHNFQCKEMEGRYVVVFIPGRAKALTLCEVEVYGSPSLNLALNGVAAQSSQFGIYKASVAIDGDRTSDFPTGSCSHTEEETNPWWRVVLSTVYRVSTVSLTNRKDCCSERLDGAEIRIGNSLENNGLNNPRCAFISRIPAGETHNFQCKEMEGRYVVVFIPGRAKALTLCEVEVYGSPSLNLALNGVAAQSSQFGIYKASVAIDGDRTSDFPTGSCSHTEEETNPWWRVVLSTVYRVSTVSLTNRKDCCSERLDGAEIRIGNSLENNGLNNPR